ncbi:MAG: hypothetical protein HY820_14020 [Acidobacteria bacterium]|nr:hypothetical protein [Acidobacteriota bacterium]
MNSQPLGLDVGTSRIVLAAPSTETTGDAGIGIQGPAYQFRSQLNAFVRLPFTRITEGVLKKENVPYSVQGQEIVVHGNEAEMFADLLGKEMRRPMRGGVLNASEPEGETQLRQIMESLLGNSEPRKIYYSVPAAPAGNEDSVTYHETAIRHLLQQLGHEVKSINEGLAVVYSELEDSNYTGIGVSCGGGLCNVCLSYLSVPVLSFSIAKAGDFIDASASQATGELANRIRITKESDFYFNGHFSDRVKQVLSVFYDDMIQALVVGMKDAFSASKAMPKFGRRIPMVLSGGSAMPNGFLDRFRTALNASDFPISLSEIRLANDPLHATAKGALLAALSE